MAKNKADPSASDAEKGSLPPSQGFDSTCWSLVLQAQEPDATVAREALTTLCETYWYPLYTFIRRQCSSAHEAEELTQEFFTRFLEKGFVQGAEQAKGKFRTFLFACCKHFLANQRKRDRALKRGGGKIILSVAGQEAHQRYLLEPADSMSAEKLFDRRWALTLLERGLAQLREERGQGEKQQLYDELKKHLVGDPSAASYAETAAKVSMTELAVRKAAQRLRDRYRDILREQILATVESEDQVENEIRELFAILEK